MFTHRIAAEDDIPALVALMDRSISGPLADFLTPGQIAASVARISGRRPSASQNST